MRICVLHEGDARFARANPLIQSALHTNDALASVLRGGGADCVEALLDGSLGFIRAIGADHPDLVFNACDLDLSYRPELEPHVSAILDAMRIPYTGSDRFALSLTNDKALSKEILSLHGVRTPRFVVLDGAGRGHGSRDAGIVLPVIRKPQVRDHDRRAVMPPSRLRRGSVRPDGAACPRNGRLTHRRGDLRLKRGLDAFS